MNNGGYKKLPIYMLSHELGVRVHKATLTLPRYELYEEGSQIRRSSKSVSVNIVEGYAMRKYKAVYLHDLYRAYGSALETIEHLDYLQETDSLKDTCCYQEIHRGYILLSRKLYAFIEGVAKR